MAADHGRARFAALAAGVLFVAVAAFQIALALGPARPGEAAASSGRVPQRGSSPRWRRAC
jgi:hypothetical protein